MLWQVYVFPQRGQPDPEARRIASEIEELGILRPDRVHFARGYLIEGELTRDEIERVGRELLADPVIEEFSLEGEQNISAGRNPASQLQYSELSTPHSSNTSHDSAAAASRFAIANVLLKPGVMDPVAQSVEQAIGKLGLKVDQVHTFRRYWIAGVEVEADRRQIAERVLANDAIEQVVWGPLRLDHLARGSAYRFELVRVPIRTMTDSELERVSRQGQLSLSLTEMQTIQRHFREIGRDPTDAELETLAQTWSEHCSHKTLRGRIDYEEIDENGVVTRREHFDNLLKETVFAATREIRGRLGPENDWCVSVFEDNAGIVRFDDQFNVCFKVETHNHPSAIEPYGGANTGLGGVIRDVIGTGLGAKPIANTDIFCFAPPDFPAEQLPPGVLHPKRVMKGVVAGVRDYGNRMGIPTVNGAIYFDDRYLGNPLVFCGSVGLIPRDRSKKEPKPGDHIVAVGGRTGRDGIHGATFSSIELTHESESLSGGAVQIGNAITEKMMLDVILAARDRGLYHAITDCGAGGFSSAVGEMGEKIGAEVWLDRVPLKYAGLSYTEIWISEAQERMVLAVPEQSWPELDKLCRSEGVEATVIGRFEPTGRLTLKYEGHVVGDLNMKFLHDGRPPVVRKAVYAAVGSRQSAVAKVDRGPVLTPTADCRLPTAVSSEPPYNETLRRVLSSWNVCSKEWVIRQYDHEVQGGSVIKPLVGAANDGPSDAAVIRPVLGSHRGLAIACGMSPRYGDIDPYWMAASAIDEAIRNCVAVGADPDRIAILDNFCWGNTDRPEELGKLVRAALACRDIATAYGTPFISGKDSLNNEFKLKTTSTSGESGQNSAVSGQSEGSDRIVIPPTLLISAIGQIDDVRQCVTMDLKEPGNRIHYLGKAHGELAGSHFAKVTGREFGGVPRVNAAQAKTFYRAVHAAMREGFVRSCHDLSEGGLAAGLAEMCIAGRLGASVDFHTVIADWHDDHQQGTEEESVRELVNQLFAETNSRLLLEVDNDRNDDFIEFMDDMLIKRYPNELYSAEIGEVTEAPLLEITAAEPYSLIADGYRGRSTIQVMIRLSVSELRECWQRPLRW